MIEAIDATPVDILLIEDNRFDIRMTQEAFDEFHIANELHVVRDGEAGTDYLHQRGQYTDASRPDLVLLDLNLPKKHGSKILDEIKADPDLRSIPVVVVTTSDLDEDIMGSYCHKANAFITKPIEFDDFVTMMKTIGEFWLTFVKLPSSYTSPSPN